MDETDFEEGEACYYKDNPSVDPDIVLSYIDEKLHNVLGHFQKDFQGEVLSAENLGPKFGGYGSFLPAYQSSPSIFSHQNNSRGLFQISSSPGPQNVLPAEGAPMAAAHFAKNCAAPRNLPLLNNAITASANSYEKKLDQGNKKILVKQEPVLNKQASSSDQRTLKVRIKINKDNAAKNKDAIYSGFGLNTTPSSSFGNSEESSGIPSQCAGTLDKSSPSNIIQIMTSFPVPGGSLLSPLIGSLLCLEKKENNSQTSSTKAIKNISKQKKKAVVEKRENIVLSNGEIGLNIGDKRTIPRKPEVDVKVENTENEALGQGSSSFGDKNKNSLSKKDSNIVKNKKGANMEPHIFKEAEKNDLGKIIETKKSKMGDIPSAGFVKEESLESISDHNIGNFENKYNRSSSVEKISENRSRNYCKDESVDIMKNVESRKSENYTILKADSNVPNGPEKSLSKGKKKSTRSQNSVDLASEADESLISGSYEVPKEKKKSGVVRNLKSHDDIKIVHGDSKALQPKIKEEYTTNNNNNINNNNNLAERCSGNVASKSSRSVVENKQGSLLNKSTDKFSPKDIKSDFSLKESEKNGDFSLKAGLDAAVGPVVEAPLVIEESWVQCDRCEKWRLLPYGTNAEQLPEKWVCKMLNWLLGMNSCRFSEDDTTQALHRLYQSDIQGNPTNQANKVVSDAPPAGNLRLDANHQNPCSNFTPNSRKMKPKLKETHFSENDGGPVKIPGSVKDFQQDIAKSRSINDINPKLSAEKNSQEKHEKYGDAKEKKLKNKRVADQNEYGAPKKIRMSVDSGDFKTTKKMPSFGILERELLPLEPSDTKIYSESEISLKKRKLKDWQESQTCIRVSKDGKNNLNEGNGFIKEETSDNEFRKMNKSAVSKAEGNEFILNKGDEKLRNIGKETKLKNPVHKGNGSAFNENEILNNRDQFSRPATSSSSKVSDSLKNRFHFQEAKGSPVESVSSSPIRISNLEQISPARRKNSSKNARIFLVDNAEKSLNLEDNSEKKRSGTVKKVKVSGISRSESPGLPVLDFQENNLGQKLRGKSRVRDESPNKHRSVHLVKNESDNLEGPCPSDNKSKKNVNNENAILREKSKKGSSLLSKGKDGSSGSNSERKVSIRPNESTRDGDSRELKCRIKLVKDDRGDNNSNPNNEAPQQDQINGGKNDTKNNLNRKEIKGGSSSQVVSNNAVKKNPSAEILPPSISRVNKGNASDLVPVSSCSGDSSKALNKFNNSPIPLKNDASSQSTAAFLEAENSKSYGDRLKDSGFPIEGNLAHFKAALLFLHAASLRESCSYDSNKHGEMSPMQIYSTTSKLFELCANEFEKRNELGSAALAYKCVEVAYLRVVYCKNSTMSRDRHDLQASLQIIPQGESPSSSASDVDSLNNQVMVDKSALSKGIGSLARNPPNFVRLLDFMKDVNSAMEASYKSQNTFAAATQKSSQNNEGIVLLKRVIDLSFHDVDELIRLVRTANDSISRQDFSRNKD